MPDTTLTSAELDELEALAKAATPGPWELGECENRDDRGKFTSYSVEARPSWSPDWPKAVVDTLNSGIMEVQTEHDEDGSSSWDEQGRKDAAYIAAANPATIQHLISLARSGLEARKAEESIPAIMAKLPALPKDLFEMYPGMSANSHEHEVKRYAATAIRALTHPTPASDDQVEAAAKALYEEDDPWNAAFPWPNPSDGPERAEAYRRLARAALAAMGSTKP